MTYFCHSFRVLFHDTMAYGSHHFLTNFKFQCEAREHLFFEGIVDASPEGRAAHDDTVILTRDGYTLNLAPVTVGGRVGILLSLEEPGPSSVRFCFRVVREDGAPVCAGYQTVVAVSRKTGQITAVPPDLIGFTAPLAERLVAPSFKERVHKGRSADLFPPEVVAVGRAVATSDPEHPGPRFRDVDAALESSSTPVVWAEASETRPRSSTAPEAPTKTALMFSGQGGYAPELLRGWLAAGGAMASAIREAERVTTPLLGGGLVELVQAEGAAHDRLLSANPELAQVVMYLNGVLLARALEERGLEPDLLVGHSVGELAALGAAGAFDFSDGVALICHRVRALRSLPRGLGGMLALSSGAEDSARLIAASESQALVIAVVNHVEQAVVSGPFAELERLEAAATAEGITSRRVASPYPFHHPSLAPAVRPFVEALRRRPMRAPRRRVYSPIEGRWLDDPSELPELLASHFVRPLRFDAAIAELHGRGVTRFVECGARRVVGRMVRRALLGERLELSCPGAEAGGVEDALDAAVGRGRVERPVRAPATTLPVASVARDSRRSDAAQTVKTPSSPVVAARDEMPIAVVSLGCVLPGADDPDELWQSVLDGRSGLSDAGVSDPEVRADFWAESRPTPDKTYSLLGGFVRGFAPELGGLPFSAESFAALPSGGRYLAVALEQARAPFADAPVARGLVALGATADGLLEVDEALVAEGLAAQVDPAARAQAGPALAEALGVPMGAACPTPYASLEAVVEAMVGEGVEVLSLDAACASSLYSVERAVRALRSGERDWALAGGVFAPGPANSCLFSQFLGLSANGSRPFDGAADGVVFGEGAALLGLARLPDALAAGHEIHAVIRAIGTSSDGKSPSVAVPRKVGQELAIRRAWERSGLDPASVQFVEAHATSTPVGDSVEFSALEGWFQPRLPAGLRLGLGSLKALTGHTGWAAGAASLIKVCKALGAAQIPPQACFDRPNAKIDLAASPFEVHAAPAPWPQPAAGSPRRACVSGFGFGGSNAHVIVDAYDPAIHDALADACATPRAAPRRVAVLSIATRLAAEGGGRRIDDAELGLPTGIRVLPDVLDDMDRSQVLAVKLAHEALSALPEAGARWSDEIAVVLGLTGKTELSLRVNKRLYLDRVTRRLKAGSGDGGAPDWFRALAAGLRATPASGPYTLPGLMPNVSAGRVANLLQLRGPNLVVDRAERSLLSAIEVGVDLALDGASAVVLVGALNAAVCPEYADDTRGRSSEGGVVLALCDPERVAELGVTPMCELELDTAPAAKAASDATIIGARRAEAALRGAEGLLELRDAVSAAGRDEATSLRWPNAPSLLRFASPKAGARRPSASRRGTSATDPAAVVDLSGVASDDPSLVGPVYRAAAVWRAAPVVNPGAAVSFAGESLLVLGSQPRLLERAAEALSAARVTLASPKAVARAGIVGVDLRDDVAARESLEALGREGFDRVLLVSELGDRAPFELLRSELREGALELAFVVARRFHERLRAGTLGFAFLGLEGLDEAGHAHPGTGLFGGFVKSIARQFPAASCRAVVTDAKTLDQGLSELAAELAAPPAGSSELHYRAGRRGTLVLKQLESFSVGGEPLLDADSVVLVTGGARGVTAVLTEGMMRRFGCSAVLLGRSDPAEASDEVVALGDAAFEDYEGVFYKERRAAEPGVKITALKRRFEALRSSREVARTLQRLGRQRGHVGYLKVDVQDASSVEAAVAKVLAEHGRLDMVVHGAGVQVSRQIERKSLDDLRRVVGTKLGGLVALEGAIERHHPEPTGVHVHLLTSAFSVWGNDGQEDYGAANETMNRLAEHFHRRDGGGAWSSLAWLGWIGVGMTRASEYVALAKARGLRALQAPEGQALFNELLAGEQRVAANILLADGEIGWYDLPFEGLEGAGDRELYRSAVELSVASAPYLEDHRVRGAPTLPGTFEIELAAEACAAMSPGYRVVGLEDARFERFVKVADGHVKPLRLEGRLLFDDHERRAIEVRVLSDFVHASGAVLRRDVLHFQSTLRLEREPRPLSAVALPNGLADAPVTRLPDAYLVGPDLELGGLFECLLDIDISPAGRRARYRVSDTERLRSIADFDIPAVLLDALCRLSMMGVEDDGRLPLYVPISCGESAFVAGLNDDGLQALGGELRLTTAAPRIAGEGLIHCDWAEARDSSGGLIATIQKLVARRVGAVSVGAWTSGQARG